MRDVTYRTRKDQLDDEIKAFAKRIGITGDRSKMRLLREFVRGCALIGACAERDRTLEFVDRSTYEAICRVGIMEVIGYER